MESFTEPSHMMAFFISFALSSPYRQTNIRVEGVGELGNEAEVEEKV